MTTHRFTINGVEFYHYYATDGRCRCNVWMVDGRESTEQEFHAKLAEVIGTGAKPWVLQALGSFHLLGVTCPKNREYPPLEATEFPLCGSQFVVMVGKDQPFWRVADRQRAGFTIDGQPATFQQFMYKIQQLLLYPRYYVLHALGSPYSEQVTWRP
jgi:hypothetical protein